MAIQDIEDPIYHRILQVNQEDELCTDIRDAIMDQKTKYNRISLSNYTISDGVLYYKDRL